MDSTQPTGNSQGASTLVGYGAGQIWPKGPHPIGQIYEWSLDFQYQVSPHSVAELGYTGVRGRKLLFGNPNFDLDQLPTADLALGNKLDQLVPNPFYGIITDPNSYLSQPMIAYNETIAALPGIHLSAGDPVSARGAVAVRCPVRKIQPRIQQRSQRDRYLSVVKKHG